MDPRIYFFQKLVNDPSKRILELGPLNRPIAIRIFIPIHFTVMFVLQKMFVNCILEMII